MAGVAGDPATQRMAGDRRSVIARTPIGASFSPATAGENEPLELRVSEDCRLFVDGNDEGTIGTAPLTVAFEEAGDYSVGLVPTATDSLYLPKTLTVTITPGGTPAAADLVIAEKSPTLLAAAQEKLAQFDLGVSRAEAREAAAQILGDPAQTPITNLAQGEAAIRQLAAIQQQTNHDMALLIRNVRRAFYAVAKILSRR